MDDWKKKSAFLIGVAVWSAMAFAGCSAETIAEENAIITTDDSDIDTESDSSTVTDIPDTGLASESEQDSATASEVDTEQPLLRGPCSNDMRLGGIEVSVLSDFSAVSGAVGDSVSPGAVPALEIEDGECTLWRRQNLSCIPSCESGQTCSFDGTCVPAPLQQDIGTVTIDGLSEPVSLTPMVPTNSYSNVNILHPAFQPGDVISMVTTDGYFGKLHLFGMGVEPITEPELDWTIEAGQALNLNWQPSAFDTGAKMHLELNIDQHGQTPLTLVCDFSDTGSARISAELLDGLIQSGVSGKPSGRFIRRTVDSQLVSQGCVEFVISSAKKATVSIIGTEQ